MSESSNAPGSDTKRVVPVWLRVLVLLFAAGLAGYLTLAAQREHNPVVAAPQPAQALAPPVAPPAAPPAESMFGIAGPSSKADPHIAREDAIRAAVQAGILQLAPDGGAQP